MSVEEIPSDEIVTMTDFWHRAFAANGCNPCCHACGNWIAIGDKFQLQTVKTRGMVGPYQSPKYRPQNMSPYIESMEVMICEKCDPVEFERREYEAAELFKKRKAAAGGGCFRINGMIVH